MERALFAVWATCIGTVGAFDPYTYLEEQLSRAIDRAAVQAQQRQRCNVLIADSGCPAGSPRLSCRGQTSGSARWRGVQFLAYLGPWSSHPS